jgi:hypothetical protein
VAADAASRRLAGSQGGAGVGNDGAVDEGSTAHDASSGDPPLQRRLEAGGRFPWAAVVVVEERLPNAAGLLVGAPRGLCHLGTLVLESSSLFVCFPSLPFSFLSSSLSLRPFASFSRRSLSLSHIYLSNLI